MRKRYNKPHVDIKKFDDVVALTDDTVWVSFSGDFEWEDEEFVDEDGYY